MHSAKNGAVWIASNEGLHKYDGVSFETYYCNEQTSMAGSCINEDIFGRIWYENFDGYLYYFQKGKLKALSQKLTTQYIPYALNSYFIYVFQKKGIDVFDIKTLEPVKTILLGKRKSEACAASTNSFYYLNGQNLVKLNKFNQVVKTRTLKLNDKNKLQMIWANNKLIVQGLFHEKSVFYVLDSNLNILSSNDLLGANQVLLSMRLLNNVLWLNTNNGCSLFDITGSNIETKTNFFKGKSISAAIKDYQGNYWFSSTNEGLMILPNLEFNFYPINSLNMSRFSFWNSQFVLGTSQGNCYAYNGGLLQPYFLSNKAAEIYYMEHINGSLFFSGNGFVVKWNEKEEFLLIKNLAVKKACQIDEKYFGIAASGLVGLMLKNGMEKTSSPWDVVYQSCHQDNPGLVTLAKNIRGKSMVYLPLEQKIYYSCNQGLFSYDLNKRIVPILYNGKPFFAQKLAQYNSHLFALNTKGELFMLNTNGTLESINKSIGLTLNEIRDVKFLPKVVAVFTNRGLFELNATTMKLRQIETMANVNDIQDLALINNQYHLLLKDGILKLKKLVSVQAPLKFEKKYLMAGKDIFIVFNRTISLDYTQNEIAIPYSIFNFNLSKQAILKYRLNKNQWQYIPNSTRILRFAQLQPGDYQIQFMLNGLLLNDDINFAIQPPFYKTWWFILCIIILGLAFVFIYNRRRFNKLSNEMNLKEQKLKLESELSKSVLKSIKSQMNPHFFYNALNTIQAYIFANDKRNSSTYLAKFSKLTRSILEMSEQETIKLSFEIEALMLYLELEKMRFQDEFDFKIEIDSVLDLEMIKIPSMLIQPYIENAVKHGLLHKMGNKSLNIHFSLFEKLLKVVILDNGIGRKKSQELHDASPQKHQSYANEANYKRLDLLNQHARDTKPVEIIDLYNDFGEAIGTQVTLYIPIT
jgi:hypothetical protein